MELLTGIEIIERRGMKFSTKVRYGARIMVDLANNMNKEPVLARSISKRQGISKKYMESLLTTLKKAGLVKTVRGVKGGYLLARDPKKITMEKITEVMDGPLTLVGCIDSPKDCRRSKTCAARILWADFSRTLRLKLREITLADLARKTLRKERREKTKLKRRKK